MIGLLANWRLVALAATAIAVAGAVWWFSSVLSERDALRVQAEVLRSALNDSLETLERMDAEADRVRAALEASSAAAVARADEAARLREEIARAPAEADGPVAAVLADTLDRLRAGNGDGAENGLPHDPGVTADVR